jgi:hypothetical protein
LSAVNFLDDGIKDLNAKGRATSQLNHWKSPMIKRITARK